MTTTLRARFDGRVLVPEGPVDLPKDRILQIEVQAEPSASPSASNASYGLRRLAELAEKYPADPDSPGDAATQHDHYLYGTPKRTEP